MHSKRYYIHIAAGHFDDSLKKVAPRFVDRRKTFFINAPFFKFATTPDDDAGFRRPIRDRVENFFILMPRVRRGGGGPGFAAVAFSTQRRKLFFRHAMLHLTVLRNEGNEAVYNKPTGNES